jgi:hypothetical protein
MANELSQAELVELQELEELEELESLEAQGGLANPEVEQDPSELESFGKGVVEGVPFAKDALAIGETIIESGFNEFSENLNKNQNEWNEAINIAEEKNPYSFGAGDVVGGVGSFVAANVLTGGAVAGIGGAIALGAASGVSRSEDRSISDAVEGGTTGFVFDRLGAGIGKVLRKPLQGIKNKAAKTISEAFGEGSNASKKIVHNHLNKTKQSIKQYADDLYNTTIKNADTGAEERILKAGNSFSDTLENIGIAKNDVGDNIGKALTEIDDAIGKPFLKAKDMHKNLKDTFENMAQSDDPASKKMATTLMRDIDDIFRPSQELIEETVDAAGQTIRKTNIERPWSEDWTLGRLHQYKRDVANRIKNEFKSTTIDQTSRKASHERAVVSKITGIIADTVEGAQKTLKDTPDGVIKNFFKNNKTFSNLSNAEELLLDSVSKQSSGGVVDTVKNAFKLKGLVVGGVAASTGLGGLPVAGVVIGVNQLLASPSLPAAMAVGLKKIADRISVNPNSPLLKRLTVSAGLSSETFRNSLSSVISEINLSEESIGRTTDDVYKRKDDILGALEFHAPEQAAMLRELIDNNDDDAIAGFMDEMGRNPKMKPFIESGVGFNGKVYNEADKKHFLDEIMGAQVSLAQRISLRKDLLRTGTIPIIEDDTPPRKEYQPRNRTKQRI